MTALRFVHSADIHLGKAFGGFAEGPRLGEARHQSIRRLAETAQRFDAPHILVAGDLFETPNPAPSTWRQAIAAMAEATGITWWLLPGNHDNLREAEATWEAIGARGHDNIRLLLDPAPRDMQAGAVLLPAPVAVRRPGGDPTEALAGMATAAGALRIGLAHGPITGFSEADAPAGIIAPDRDRSAGLDYLALGDWHGQMRVSDRVWYSGAPERDRFKHDGRGACLVVDIDGPGATPRVQPVETGAFTWRDLGLDLLPGQDPAAALAALLPEAGRRDTLIRIAARGRARLSEASALAQMEAHHAPEFCHFALDLAGLAVEVDAADLDAIAGSGALRQAADTLSAAREDGALSQRERDVATAALRRLHALVSGGAA